jgi:hypothetical protein
MTEWAGQAKEKMIVVTKFMNRMALETISTAGLFTRIYFAMPAGQSKTGAFLKGHYENELPT